MALLQGGDTPFIYLSRDTITFQWLCESRALELCLAPASIDRQILEGFLGNEDHDRVRRKTTEGKTW